MKKSLLVLAAITLAGCATPADKLEAAKHHDEAQAKFYSEQRAARKPLVEIKAAKDAEITGLESITVYAPETEYAYVAAPIQRSEFAEGLHEVRETVLGAAPYVLGTKLISGVADMNRNTASAGTAGYPYVQAQPVPPANIVYGANSGANSGNTGNLAAGTGSTVTAPIATSPPTVVNQPAPVVVQPATPVIVPATPPVIVTPLPGQICVINALGVTTCH